LKPLSIEISAFGPFAKAVDISFEAFKGQGIFLITGDTGAGKTTLFDAIAFALYGEASGSIRSADTFRSDFSVPTTQTYVELRFEHKNKRYSVLRNPSYERPKKTGEGVTKESADARLIMPTGDVITGFREVTQHIESIMGVNFKQFKQIAMIAQNEFLELLLAESKERGEIFRRVFNTDLYLKSQLKLKDMERESKKKCEKTELSLIQYIKGIICEEVKDGELNRKIENANSYNALEIYGDLEKINQRDGIILEKYQDEIAIFEDQLTKQAIEIIEAQGINSLFERLELINVKKDELMLKLTDIEAVKIEIKTAQKARDQVRPFDKEAIKQLENVSRLKERIKRNKDRFKQTKETLSINKARYENEKLKEIERESIALSINKLEASLQLFQQIKVADEKIRIDEMKKEKFLYEQNEALRQKAQFSTGELELDVNIKALNYAEVSLLETKQKLELLIIKNEQILKISKKIYDIKSLKIELKNSQEIFINKEKEYMSAEAHFTLLETAYYREQAGLLASKLVENEPCPVCGSKDHPEKAQLSVHAPTKEALDVAKKEKELYRESMIKASKNSDYYMTSLEQKEKVMRIEFNEIICHTDENFNRMLTAPIALENNVSVKQIETVLLDFEKKLKDEINRLSEEEKVKKEAIITKDRLQNELIKLRESIDKNNQKLIEIDKEIILIDNKLIALSTELKSIKAQMTYSSEVSVVSALEENRNKLKVLKESLEKSENDYRQSENDYTEVKTQQIGLNEQLKESEAQYEQAQSNYLKALSECGFMDELRYKTALKTDREIENLMTRVEVFEEQLKEVSSEKTRLERELENKSRTNLDELMQRNEDVKAKKNTLNQKNVEMSAKHKSNKITLKNMKEALSKIESERALFLQISDLSKTANGELAGKQKIAFEQYVQSAYFDRILYEANKRLNLMTSGRYELSRKVNASNLRSQSGLEIDVIDHYTGHTRSVKSLSGGESFKASLSLALGLSDVIQSHSGGVEINTLFIDEGFGSLDAESLEQAIQTLSGLAVNNRLIGIISHVSELKDRIDRQIFVQKSNRGSQVSIICEN